MSFVKESLPKLDATDYNYQFSDGGWLQIADELIQAKNIALLKLLVFSGAALFALILTVWLFIGRKKKEYGILRALGMPKGAASGQLFIPFLILGVAAAVVGLAAARIVTVRQLEMGHTPAGFSLFLVGALCFLVLLVLAAFVGLLHIRRRSVLELIQEKHK